MYLTQDASFAINDVVILKDEWKPSNILESNKLYRIHTIARRMGIVRVYGVSHHVPACIIRKATRQEIEGTKFDISIIKENMLKRSMMQTKESKKKEEEKEVYFAKGQKVTLIDEASRNREPDKEYTVEVFFPESGNVKLKELEYPFSTKYIKKVETPVEWFGKHEKLEVQPKEETGTEEIEEMSALKGIGAQVDGDHYLKLGIQPLEMTYLNFGYEGLKASIFTKVTKYMTRKKDNELTQLKKARHCLDILIEKAEIEQTKVEKEGVK